MTATNIKKMDLYWFSGSGNTLRAAEVFADRLRSKGWTVRLLPIEKKSAELFDPQAVFGLAFPTHCFSIPLVVRAFLRRIPLVDKTPAVYLGTHGLFSGGVRGHLKSIFRRKGFNCLAGRIFLMPDSFFPFCGNRFNQWLIKKSLIKVERFAERIATGKKGWFRIPILSSFAEMFCFGFFASRKLSVSTRTTVHFTRKKTVVKNQNFNEEAKEKSNVNASEDIDLKVGNNLSSPPSSDNTNSDNTIEHCRSCRLCMRFCPVGAISLDENEKTEISGEKCQNCLRCVAICSCDKMRHLFFSPYHGESSVDFKNRLSSALNQNNR